MDIQDQCVAAYRKHRHLKIAAKDVGIPWQTLYVHLKRAGEPVLGDRMRYGSCKDRLAAGSEMLFSSLVPNAEDQNRRSYQSRVDFVVGQVSVDVKASTLKRSSKKASTYRWAFSVKKQEAIADFFVCFGFAKDMSLARTLLLPGELARYMTTINLPERGGKWSDYLVNPKDLAPFFDAINQANRDAA